MKNDEYVGCLEYCGDVYQVIRRDQLLVAGTVFNVGMCELYSVSIDTTVDEALSNLYDIIIEDN